ncbi:short-chain dehydrogenase/reductase [Talaromyces proteolyticus]|uniref:Short-chain dehydrogenase/reductase n=1 Tax=Talaromyces proteolyticus TaxID=1131652 RepID=A0AAD4PWI1_9EURO|nr:short-chain dehydrogenase/reductase [Talaromyces proteolyticus]KAH8697890.1 short-chain dehydrogenase/reductase [Talaromyces proteolyticus]
MVSLQTVQRSNARIANLPHGLVALFIGATSGIGQAALQNFAQHTSSARIYSVARTSAVQSHETLLGALRQSNPRNIYNLVTADVSLISEIDRIYESIAQNEVKLDILFMSAGFMAFEGRKDTREGLDPSMTTRYYSRLRAIQSLLPLLNSADSLSPRVISVLAGGKEEPLNEEDLDLRDPHNWSYWNSSVHSCTMGTLTFERVARQNPRLSIVHWYPGPVETPGMIRSISLGMSPPSYRMGQEEAGARAIFLATNDRYAVDGGGFVSVPTELGSASKSGGGIFLVDPWGESVNNERVLAELRKRGIDEKVWSFTQKLFASKTA